MTEKQRPKVTVDGTVYEVPRMKFKQLKACWPIILKAQSSDDPMEMTSGGIEVLSKAMMREHPHMTLDWLEDNMDIEETKEVGSLLAQIMVDAGLISMEDARVALSGEVQGAEVPAAPSTETLTPSSPNSSEPVAAEPIGTT